MMAGADGLVCTIRLRAWTPILIFERVSIGGTRGPQPDVLCGSALKSCTGARSLGIAAPLTEWSAEATARFLHRYRGPGREAGRRPNEPVLEDLMRIRRSRAEPSGIASRRVRTSA